MSTTSEVKVLTTIDLPGLAPFKSGKVRDVFDVGDTLLFVVSDRISAFDCILPTGIPFKGHVLNQLAAWWFERMGSIVENHVLATRVEDYPESLKPYADILRGRSMLVKKAEALPVECVVRGYIIGSGWKEYQQSQSICGLPLREGYQLADKLDKDLFTPSTKAETGHDENITFEETIDLVGEDVANQVRELSLTIYQQAAAYALERGIIIADTKFEFGLIDGRVVLIDEILTPDSSRFWPADTYQAGISPPSFDKQFVRDYLETLDWNKEPPAPELPEDIFNMTSEKYRQAYQVLTGSDIVT